VRLTLRWKEKEATFVAVLDGDGRAAGGWKAVFASLSGWTLAPLRYAADLMLPPVCLNCHEPLASHAALCAHCWQRIDFIRTPLCDRLGLPLPYCSGEVSLSSAALRRTPDYGRARAVARFDGVMRELIHRLKYSDRHELLTLFTPMMRSAGHELIPAADCLVPVPLHRWRLWHRRFNQAAMLAGRLGRMTGLPVEFQALARVKRTVSQVNLSWDERRRNVEAAFAVLPGHAERIQGRHVLLIDDVVTTGATVEACARVLKAAGAREVDVLALALVADYPVFYD
jgi:ComF family protein